MPTHRLEPKVDSPHRVACASAIRVGLLGGLILLDTLALSAEEVILDVGARKVAVTTPQGMLATDRSKDLMADFVKAHFKDLLRGTQMVTFSPAKDPGAFTDFSILITDGKFVPQDIPGRIKMTLDFIADKKRLTEKTLNANKAMRASGQVEVEPPEEIRRRTEGAVEAVLSAQDDRHFIMRLSGDGYANFMATLACESRQVVLYSHGEPASSEARLAQLKSFVKEITTKTAAEDPSYKAPRHMDTVRSASGRYQYEVPVAWVRRPEKGVAEPVVCFITHGSGGTVCNAVFLEDRTVPNSSAAELLRNEIALAKRTLDKPPVQTGSTRDGVTAKGLAYAEADFIGEHPRASGKVATTITFISLGSDCYLVTAFNTNHPSKEVFVRGYRDLIESLAPLQAK
ncbi:MAG: hypothetical protein ACKOCD_02165 [Nitrospiraceae bacterium]